jgi:hypothetical protein
MRAFTIGWMRKVTFAEHDLSLIWSQALLMLETVTLKASKTDVPKFLIERFPTFSRTPNDNRRSKNSIDIAETRITTSLILLYVSIEGITSITLQTDVSLTSIVCENELLPLRDENEKLRSS